MLRFCFFGKGTNLLRATLASAYRFSMTHQLAWQHSCSSDFLKIPDVKTPEIFLLGFSWNKGIQFLHTPYRIYSVNGY